MTESDGQFAFPGIEPPEPAEREKIVRNPVGRPKGAKNRTTGEIHAMIKLRGINFLHKMWDRAERLEDEIDFKCAVFIGSRIWTKPRGTLVEIDLSQNVDARALLSAVSTGQITPGDAASLWNSISRNGHGGAAAIEASASRGDIREAIAGRLAKMIEARALPAGPGDDAGNQL